jgi:hypothetical protein
MNLKYLLNTLIIILIIFVFLHTIYRNNNNNYNLSNIQENFFKKNEYKITDKELEEKQLLINKDYIKNTSWDKNYVIKPGNFYTSDDNIVNFPSNVLNVNEYYVRNQIDSNQNLRESSNEGNIGSNDPKFPNRGIQGVSPEGNIIERNKSNDPTFSNFNYENTYHKQPNMWNYQDELVMNGGKIGDFIGNGYYDLNSAFSENKYTNKEFKNEIMNEYKNDDLRMGLGVPAKMSREFND